MSASSRADSDSRSSRDLMTDWSRRLSWPGGDPVLVQPARIASTTNSGFPSVRW